MIRVIFYTIACLHLFGCASASVSGDGLALRKSLPIQIYMETCVVGRAGPEAVESQAIEMGFSPVSGNAAHKYLSGNTGKAWRLTNEQGQFGLTVLNNTLCSVFIHQGEPTALQKSMEAWLPPKNSGFTYKRHSRSQSEFLETTSYQIFRGGQLMEQWVITINTQPGAELVAVMSYDGP
jgi:hypothetical protein